MLPHHLSEDQHPQGDVDVNQRLLDSIVPLHARPPGPSAHLPARLPPRAPGDVDASTVEGHAELPRRAVGQQWWRPHPDVRPHDEQPCCYTPLGNLILVSAFGIVAMARHPWYYLIGNAHLW